MKTKNIDHELCDYDEAYTREAASDIGWCGKCRIKECSCYIYNCFSTETRIVIKEDLERSGGIKNMPWWKWCLEHCHVSYDK
jgi:hypothetical protein